MKNKTKKIKIKEIVADNSLLIWGLLLLINCIIAILRFAFVASDKTLSLLDIPVFITIMSSAFLAFYLMNLSKDKTYEVIREVEIIE